MADGTFRMHDPIIRDPLIRDMEPGDREAVIDLIWQLNRFEHAISGDRALDRDAAARCYGVNQRRVRENGGCQLVAELNGEVVAYACCVIEQASAYMADAHRRHAWLAELIVADRARGQGFGEALIRACESHVTALGVPTMRIGALAGNAAANRLYEKLGYAPYVVERQKRLDDG
jgi:ribosomal protein S18 acetylase RimI-like enzyme